MGELAIAILTALCSVMQSEEATLLFAGDAMMHQRQLDAAREKDNLYAYDGYFDMITPLISDADYAVVNLETPVSGAPYSGYPTFNAPDTYAIALKDAGFDLFLNANNHTLDRHDRGLLRTLNLLDSIGVDHLGTYTNLSERKAIIPFIRDIKGYKVGFLNYTYGTNGISVQGDVVVDTIDRKLMAQDVKRTRDAGAEIICVMVHWGDEYKLLPNQHQKALADYLADLGVELIIGGHPHVIQPCELHKDEREGTRLVVYSLGNFVSGMQTDNTRGGAIVRAKLKRDSMGRAYVDEADYDLVFTLPPSANRKNYTLIYADSCVSGKWKSKCDAFRSNATQIFDKHNINVNKRQAF